jgi:serine/threonine-protein phosphatase 4 catalytic subunit
LALGAIVDGRVFCVHGGLSPQVARLDQVSARVRAERVLEPELPVAIEAPRR